MKKVIEIDNYYTSETMAEFNPDELQAIAAAFKDLNVKPKADSASELKQWMVEFVTQMKAEGGTAEVKQEPGTEPVTAS